ncbi:hypothetical protein HYH03_018219 [Edaphochlamys debaryana]|uniref:Uncharacterized protein n=1 Tax=Edaphochlamys debaryana TaxID=47281 RepID=A0A836BNB9_9CHLO|nr:hypothetical protein HYH03_018219 [Edaphochlamys debaryana]|eukprot:KAG2482875.1 hypothetical protein HYH03_018219 [Edaphochlamys debaryana]
MAAPVVSPKGSAAQASYQDIRAKNYSSKAKSLLYGGDDRPETPVHIGKKAVSHKGAGGAAPFATYTGPEESSPVAGHKGASQSAYQTKPKAKEGAGKPTGAAFNADVYRQQIADNYLNMQAQKARAGGSGIFN